MMKNKEGFSVCVCIFLPVNKLCVLLFEFRLEVAVGQTVTFQLCHLLLQITDLREQQGFELVLTHTELQNSIQRSRHHTPYIDFSLIHFFIYLNTF